MKPWARHKWDGFIDEWPTVRLFIEGMECYAELLPSSWPKDVPTEPGTQFTLHFRGSRLLYLYVIQGPLITRSQLKRARLWARNAMKLLFVEDA